ncbi:MAG: outer membrane beta-barrel protein [Bacteroidia bacterium]|nr:outer membrane beta-barrel protein [Bacteroidia bacterium]
MARSAVVFYPAGLYRRLRAGSVRSFLLFFSLLNFYGASSQVKFSSGVIAGITATQYDGDSHAGYNKLGFTGGFFTCLDLNARWKTGFEILYFQKGARKYPVPAKGDFTQYALSLDYAEIPLFLRWEQKMILAEAGVSIGFLVREKEILNEVDITGQRPFGATDVSFFAGAGWKWLESWEVALRYGYSILPVRPHASGAVHYFNRGEYNNTLCLRIRYTFGKKKDTP